jgi:hypothetical protein
MDKSEKLSETRKRLMNTIAENALRRGYKLTPKEKLENLEREFGFEPGYFAKLRQIKD